MKRQVVLTVAESKRLIAKGVAALPEVQKAMKEGMVVVATGTTNAYVLEELWGRRFDKRRYRSGITTPKEPERLDEPQEERIPDVVFRRGEVAEDLDRYNAVEHMGKGDVYLKGANALNYDEGVAGVLIGSPTGGTVGAVLGNIIGKKINLVIPIGLEKLVNDDIYELSWLGSQEDSEGPSLWPITGTIITEIEALGILAGVDAYLYAAGGIAGAEGAVRLLLDGTEEQVQAALELVESIKGEPKYLL
ncbi:MAG: hypothetical protein NWE75_01010 [Candidatus Bathyarchaeota archaeon]|nr:hypothetical protein [Candidatus Bathyarchaeota archaeon]